jgi:hypothetical protein
MAILVLLYILAIFAGILIDDYIHLKEQKSKT